MAMIDLKEAAANIVDVMMGNDRSWRSRLDNLSVLDNYDWTLAMSYAKAALRACNDEQVTVTRESTNDLVRLQMEAERGRILAAAIVGGDDTGGFDTDELVRMVKQRREECLRIASDQAVDWLHGVKKASSMEALHYANGRHDGARMIAILINELDKK